MEDSTNTDRHDVEWMPLDEYAADSDVYDGKKRNRSNKERTIQMIVILFLILIVVALWLLK